MNLPFVACPKCGVPVTKLLRHLKKIHGIGTEQQGLKISSAGTNKKNSGRNAKNSMDATLERSGGSGDERQFDATRYYYASYRDAGRFGSHPSHDDYGEEAQL